MRNADSILSRMKSDLKLPQSKMELSFASDNLQAVSKEVELMYAFAEYINEMHFVDTATGEALDRNALAYHIVRKEATKATGKVVFEGEPDVVIPAGYLVKTKDGLIYKTLEQGVIASDRKVTVSVACLEAGRVGNTTQNTIVVLSDKISGLEHVNNEFPITSGTEREDDETLRERLLLRIRMPATSGNKYHYQNWALSVDGVGRVKVFPLWNGPGTVKVSIINADHESATSELINKVRDFIDPLPGQGEGKAPIGATLTVSTASYKLVNIDCTVTIHSGTDEGSVKNKIIESIGAYFKKHAYTDMVTLSYAMMVNMIFDVDGVRDIQDVKMNGGTESIQLADEEIYRIGKVTVNGI